MTTPYESLIATGTKLWLASIDPALVADNRAKGATGATSNPVIIAGLIKTGRYDAQLEQLMRAGHDDAEVAWLVTDQLVSAAEDVFLLEARNKVLRESLRQVTGNHEGERSWGEWNESYWAEVEEQNECGCCGVGCHTCPLCREYYDRRSAFSEAA